MQMSYLKLFNSRHIVETYEIIGEWEVWVGSQQIKVKVKKNRDGKFFHSLSHHYWGSEQAGPYVSSITGPYETAEEAIQHAQREMLSFYNPSDEKAEWVKNDYF